MPRILLLLALALVFGWSQPADAQNFPKLTGRVVDQADLLDPAQEVGLAAKLQNLENTTQRQMVVATVASLEGNDIADYGYKLGRHWGIGDKVRNDGIVLLVAPNERKVHFAVGYGLEPVMPDIFAYRVIQDDILPRFKSGDFPGGINAGVDRASAQLRLPPEEAAKVAAAAEKKKRQSSNGGEISAIIFWLFIFFFVILPIIRAFGSAGRRHRGRDNDGLGPIIIWGGGSGGGSSWGGGGSSSWGGGGFSGGGGSFGGGGASGGW